MAVKINEGECLGCGMCANACPQTAITVEDVAKVDEATCIECGICVDECPVQAISL